MSNIEWEKTVGDYTFQIVTSLNWRNGIPKNLKAPKYLIKIANNKTGLSHVPTDQELEEYAHILPLETLQIFEEAIQIKEKHNYKNLKNPEQRKIERYILVINRRRKVLATPANYKYGDKDS